MGRINEAIKCISYTLAFYMIMVFLGMAFGIANYFEGVFSAVAFLAAFVGIYLTWNP